MLPSGGDATTTMGNMTPEQASRQFDIHRREATKLERQLEDRVARYQQVRTRVLVPLALPNHDLSNILNQARVSRVRVCGGRSKFVLYSFATPPLAHPVRSSHFSTLTYIYIRQLLSHHFRTLTFTKIQYTRNQYVYTKPNHNISSLNVSEMVVSVAAAVIMAAAVHPTMTIMLNVALSSPWTMAWAVAPLPTVLIIIHPPPPPRSMVNWTTKNRHCPTIYNAPYRA